MKPGAALALAALILTGCAHFETVDDGLGYERRQDELGRIPGWDLSGGIVVDTGERAYQSRFSWQQRDGDLELRVNGRLGVGRTLIQGNESRLTVEAQGDTQVLTEPERQLSEMLGWWLPVTSAEHWLLGRPDPDFASETTRGVFDTLATLDQRDWRISFDEYQIADGRLVPRRMTLTHSPLVLSLRIIEWVAVGIDP